MSLRDIPPFRGNLWGALLASPVRGGGKIGDFVGGVLAPMLQFSTAPQQARSGGKPVEENAFVEMSFKWVDRQLPNEQCRDEVPGGGTQCRRRKCPWGTLEHRRWLEFGLGTDARPTEVPLGDTRLAPIRQGEGVSRTISGDSKGQRVLWRVFLCYLSSREERWHPRRALPFEKRFVSSGVVTGFIQLIDARNNPPAASSQSPRTPFPPLGRKAPFTPLLLLSPPNPLTLGFGGDPG